MARPSLRGSRVSDHGSAAGGAASATLGVREPSASALCSGASAAFTEWTDRLFLMLCTNAAIATPAEARPPMLPIQLGMKRPQSSLTPRG